jgi:hypothetical protein
MKAKMIISITTLSAMFILTQSIEYHTPLIAAPIGGEYLTSFREAQVRPTDLGTIEDARWNMVQLQDNLKRDGGGLAKLKVPSLVKMVNRYQEVGLIENPQSAAPES